MNNNQLYNRYRIVVIKTNKLTLISNNNRKEISIIIPIHNNIPKKKTLNISKRIKKEKLFSQLKLNTEAKLSIIKLLNLKNKKIKPIIVLAITAN